MRRVALVAALVAVAAAAAAFAATRPDPAAHAQLDGCGRDVAGLFKKEQPTWAYVGDRDAPASAPAPAPQWARGVVNSPEPPWYAVHPTTVDDPVTHDSFDLIMNIKVDPELDHLVGGDPASRTGNYAGNDEETGRLHTEWEEAAFSLFAWPEQGDRVEVLGSWIWDCGHWQPGGERTEFHPIRAIWVQRAGVSARSPYGEAEGDLFVSTDKTPAGASADCSHKTKGDRAAFKACLAAEPNWQNANGSYRFTLRAPRRPSPGAKLNVRVVDAGSTSGAPFVKVEPGPAGATVSLDVAEPAGKRVVVAKQVFVGWRPMPAAALPEHLRLRFEQILVRRAMDPGCPPTDANCASVQTTRKGQISQAPGEWLLYWDVAGIWSHWRPVVLRPRDGQTLPASQTVDVYVARGKPWRVFVTGRECDNGRISASDVTRPPAPCPQTDEFLDLIGDDAPGNLVDSYRSPAAGIGRHASNALVEESSCPPVNKQGCFQVTYSVARVADAGRRAALTR